MKYSFSKKGASLKPISLPKKKPDWNKSLCQWIRSLRCAMCGQYNDIDSKTGSMVNDVSHVLTRGAGHGDENNVLPMCRKCHQYFEDQTTSYREKFLVLARKYTEAYHGVGYLPMPYVNSPFLFDKYA